MAIFCEVCSLEQTQSRLLPLPDLKLLNVHLALHLFLKVNSDHTIRLPGPFLADRPHLPKKVTVIFHPHCRFWVVSTPPNPDHPA